jgi:hypothetical protein
MSWFVAAFMAAACAKGAHAPAQLQERACVPRTCAAKACGELPDGCGHFLTCGGCAKEELCGGAGSANVCAQEPSLAPVVVGAAGDIACDADEKHFNHGAGDKEGCQQRATSDLLLKMNPSAVLALGDEQYPAGAPDSFARSFEPTWGRLRSVLHAVPGNHEYLNDQARGYFDYFGASAGRPGEGWYSFDVGGWHIIGLNSNCDRVDCAEGGKQVRWLKEDLAAHPATCTLAFWHHPLFSSGAHGGTRAVSPFWDALYSAGADLVLTGHDHHYERFGPQRPDGTLDTAHGVREFVVGTGGKSQYAIPREAPHSEAHRTDTFGVLKLTLYPSRYRWEFLSTDGSFHDEGEASCH